MRIGRLATVVWVLAGAVSGCSAAAVPVRGMSVDGRWVALRSGKEVRAVVLLFVATDCPISNRYAPEMRRQAREFAGAGARFWWVYPNTTETAAGVRAHMAAYGAEAGVALRDPDGALARGTGAKATPEAAVLVPDGPGLRVVYAGRVDDRYVSLGTERPVAERHDLEEAVRAAVEGKTVQQPGGPVVGCGIVGAR